MAGNTGQGSPWNGGSLHREWNKRALRLAIGFSCLRAVEPGGHRGGVAAGCFQPTDHQLARQHPLVEARVQSLRPGGGPQRRIAPS
jgi:hypothetical protein